MAIAVLVAITVVVEDGAGEGGGVWKSGGGCVGATRVVVVVIARKLRESYKSECPNDNHSVRNHVVCT
jgi:hypothetical protein